MDELQFSASFLTKYVSIKCNLSDIFLPSHVETTNLSNEDQCYCGRAMQCEYMCMEHVNNSNIRTLEITVLAWPELRNMSLEIGNQCINEHYGEWLHICNELTQERLNRKATDPEHETCSYS
jgi:hypothetical protein